MDYFVLLHLLINIVALKHSLHFVGASKGKSVINFMLFYFNKILKVLLCKIPIVLRS